MQYLRKPKTKNKLTAISQCYFKGVVGISRQPQLVGKI